MVDTPRSPIDVVKSFMAAVAKKDFDTALRYVSDDCEYHNIPLARVHGPAGVRGVWEVHDGRITVWREYFDAPTLMNIMKAWPAPTN